MLVWISIGLAGLLLFLLCYWLLDVTEGAYLGPQIVTFLYDWSAPRYDALKGFSSAEEAWFLARPLLNRLAAVSQPLVLDVATGTGRLPRALFREEHFQGGIVALDLAHRMLEQAVSHTEGCAGRILFLQQDATLLPFPDAIFDAVTCLEALEFLPCARCTLREMARVLCPGGVLLTTNRRGLEARLFFGRTFTRAQIVSLLAGIGLQGITVQSWQHIYDLVWARKPGSLLRDRTRVPELPALVRCPQCQGATLHPEAVALCCPHCGALYPVKERIVALQGAIRESPLPDVQNKHHCHPPQDDIQQ